MERLTPEECARLGSLPGRVDCERVRLHRASSVGPAGALRRLVLRLSRGRAIALGNHVFLPDRWPTISRCWRTSSPIAASSRPGGRAGISRGAPGRSFASCSIAGWRLPERLCLPAGRRKAVRRLRDGAAGSDRGGFVSRRPGGARRVAVPAAERPRLTPSARCRPQDAPSAWSMWTWCSVVSGSRSSHSASTLPSGSATIAMIPQDCCVGSVTNWTPRSCSSPQ